MKRAILCLSWLVIMALNVPADESKIFSVSADAIVRVAPNRVVLQIGAETRGENLTAVRQANSDIVRNTIEIFKKNGIEDRYIGTDRVDINIYYDDRRDYRDRILGFTVIQSLTITINDISKYDIILTEAIDAGINQIYNIDFQTDDLKKYRFEARALAIAAAKEKAEFLAREAGFQLGKIINLRERTNDFYWRPRANDRGGMSQNMVQSYDGDIGGSDTLAPGMISIRSDITLFYEVE